MGFAVFLGSTAYIWSLLECAALGRSSQYGTRGFPGLTANPQHMFGPSWSVRHLAAPRSMGPAVFLGSPRNPQHTFGSSWSVRLLTAPRSMGPAVFLGSPPTHSTLKTVPTNCESHLRHNDLDTKMPTIHRSTQVASELIASKQLKDPQSKQQLSSTRRCLKRARTPFSRVAKRTSVTRNNRRGHDRYTGKRADNHSVSYESLTSDEFPIRHLYRISRCGQNNKTRHDCSWNCGTLPSICVPPRAGCPVTMPRVRRQIDTTSRPTIRSSHASHPLRGFPTMSHCSSHETLSVDRIGHNSARSSEYRATARAE